MQRADVIILGGGLVGLTLAIALDRHGLATLVVDPADPATQVAPGYDGRATAVSSSSWRMLEAIGVAGRLEGVTCAIRAIRVSEGLKPGGISFEPGEADDPLGIMVVNRLLRGALRDTALAAAQLQLLMPARPAEVVRDGAGVRVALADGRLLAAPVLIGAEGRNSPTRSAAGIAVAQWRYDHVAIVAAKRMGGFLGAIELVGPRFTSPLGFHHAARITGERLALIGDAAHGIHPIAGQGLNLGFRDAAALAEVLVEGARLGLDLGDAQLMARYERWRSLDTFSVALATDSLTRLYGIPGRAASAIRRLGMGAVQRIGPLKERFMAEARGEAGELPLLLRGLPI